VGQPANFTNQDCIAMASFENHYWVTAECDEKKLFVCEFRDQCLHENLNDASFFLF
jgi:hypothetical protein